MKDAAYIKAKLEQYSEYVTESGCRIWLGAHNIQGYGQLRFDYKCYLAHRVAWQMEHGPIPHGIGVLHRCDITFCINVHHLFLGTQQDNANDMKQKRRHAAHKGTLKMPTGKDHHFYERGPKITREDAERIRAMSGSQAEIARIYHVHQSMISCIKRNKSWK